MVLPTGAAQSRKTDKTVNKALARAFRWKQMLEAGEFTSIAELAVREVMASSFLLTVPVPVLLQFR